MLVCIQSSQLVFLQKKYLDEYIHLESGSHYFWRKHRSKDYFNCLQSYRILWSNFRYTLITVPLSLVVPSKWSKVMHASIFWRHTALPVSTIEPPKKFCFFFMCETLTSDGRAKLLATDCTSAKFGPFFSFHHQKCIKAKIIWYKAKKNTRFILCCFYFIFYF